LFTIASRSPSGIMRPAVMAAVSGSGKRTTRFFFWISRSMIVAVPVASGMVFLIEPPVEAHLELLRDPDRLAERQVLRIDELALQVRRPVRAHRRLPAR
jgi:hypothetical protein